MSVDYRAEVLNQYVIATPTATEIVNLSLIPADAPARQKLVDYHPSIGPSYLIITRIEEDADGTFLRIVPQVDVENAAWSRKQIDLLGQLRFIPMPEVRVPGRNPVLQMMRSGSGNIRVANSPWYLVYSRIEKIQISGKWLNDVTLIWEFVDPTNAQQYRRPVATCWKW